jgi:hypothetical protein
VEFSLRKKIIKEGNDPFDGVILANLRRRVKAHGRRRMKTHGEAEFLQETRLLVAWKLGFWSSARLCLQPVCQKGSQPLGDFVEPTPQTHPWIGDNLNRDR